MTIRRIVLGVAMFIAAAGWSVSANSCCMRQACQNTKFLDGAIKSEFRHCCSKPEGAERDACLDTAHAKCQQTISMLLEAKMACDNRDDELLHDTIKRIRDLWAPKIISDSNGKIVNTMVVLLRQDWMALDTTLTLTPQDPCKSVTLAIAPQGVVNAEATGKAIENDGDSASVAIVVPAAAAQSYTSCTYIIPTGTTADLRMSDEYPGIALSGSIALARTNVAIPEGGTTVAAIPTDVQMSASMHGRKLTLALDKTNPFNALRLDAQGKGTLGVALTLDSKSTDLIGLIYVGATIYFEFPVEVNEAWTTVRLNVPRARPGNELTPTPDFMLAGTDGTPVPLPPYLGDRCADANGNGVPDGADWYIHDISSSLECSNYR